MLKQALFIQKRQLVWKHMEMNQKERNIEEAPKNGIIHLILHGAKENVTNGKM